jgi:hypothetical protein
MSDEKEALQNLFSRGILHRQKVSRDEDEYEEGGGF